VNAHDAGGAAGGAGGLHSTPAQLRLRQSALACM
jgi:hypothetical protein